jgi:hypothetical protein
MRPEHLLPLYPRAWRERYGEEFLATVGDGKLGVQQTVDIVSAAIDAWFSADVRRATVVSRVAPNRGGPMMLKSLMVCERAQARYTKRDALIGAGVMVGASLVLTIAGVAARRAGWSETGEVLVAISFPVSMTLSMPFWLMKGQPWKAQVAIVGGTLLFLAGIGYLSILI